MAKKRSKKIKFKNGLVAIPKGERIIGITPPPEFARKKRQRKTKRKTKRNARKN